MDADTIIVILEDSEYAMLVTGLDIDRLVSEYCISEDTVDRAKHFSILRDIRQTLANLA